MSDKQTTCQTIADVATVGGLIAISTCIFIKLFDIDLGYLFTRIAIKIACMF